MMRNHDLTFHLIRFVSYKRNAVSPCIVLFFLLSYHYYHLYISECERKPFLLDMVKFYRTDRVS